MAELTTSKLGIEFDPEAQQHLEVPLGKRELYPYPGMSVAEVLKEQGTNVVFGVPGGHIWLFTDPIERIGIKILSFGSEVNATYAAEAYAQVSGKVGVVFGTVGPGVALSVNGVQQASLSCTPMIFLAGGHEIEHDGLKNTIQESYATELMGPVTKWSQRIVYPHTIKQFLTRGYKLAQSYPGGPVCFEMGIDLLTTTPEVSKNVFMGVWGQHNNYVPNWRGENTAKPLLCGGAPQDIAEAVQAIYAAERPFIQVGDGATWAQAGPELQEFLELAQVPFTAKRLGRGVVSEKHPLACRSTDTFRKDIDLMVPIGLKVGFFVDGFGSSWPESVQIAESTEHIWTYLRTKAAVVGNPKVVLQQMIDYIKANNLQVPAGRAQWVQRCQQAQVESTTRRRQKAMYYGFDHPRYQTNAFMHYGYVCQATQDFVEERYGSRVRVIADGFTVSDFGLQIMEATRPAQVLGAGDNAGVGHGIGMAIGAAVAQLEMGDHTPVLSLMGDSGMGECGLDVETAVKLKLPIVYLVTNNDGWMPAAKYMFWGPNWENKLSTDQVGEWKNVPNYADEKIPGLRWDKIAETLGAYGETVTQHDQFAGALERAFAAAERGQPAVLNCIMDQRILNRGYTHNGGFIGLTNHLPYHELPKHGKRLRRYYWSNFFEGLEREPGIQLPDSWEPVADEDLER